MTVFDSLRNGFNSALPYLQRGAAHILPALGSAAVGHLAGKAANYAANNYGSSTQTMPNPDYGYGSGQNTTITQRVAPYADYAPFATKAAQGLGGVAGGFMGKGLADLFSGSPQPTSRPMSGVTAPMVAPQPMTAPSQAPASIPMRGYPNGTRNLHSYFASHPALSRMAAGGYAGGGYAGGGYAGGGYAGGGYADGGLSSLYNSIKGFGQQAMPYVKRYAPIAGGLAALGGLGALSSYFTPNQPQQHEYVPMTAGGNAGVPLSQLMHNPNATPYNSLTEGDVYGNEAGFFK